MTSWDNETIHLGHSGIIVTSLACKVVISILMISLDTIAIFTNLTVILVIVSTPCLRYNITNLYIINLCTLNFLGSVLVLPVSIAVFIQGDWIFGDVFCSVNGFCNSLFLFVTLLNVCVISVERYYAIKMPMHHSAHMTMSKTLLIIGLVFVYSSVLASLPLYGWNSYSFRPNKGHCSFTWGIEDTNNVFVITVTVLCFVIPGLILLYTYIGIFNIARMSSNHVVPAVQVNKNSHNVSHNIKTVHKDMARLSYSSSAPSDMMRDIRTPSVDIQIRRPTRHTSPSNNHSNDSHKPPVIKTGKSLTLIVLVYLLLWGPYFFLYIAAVTKGEIQNEYFWEYFVTWLAYSSFAVNPFVYGLLNKNIREHLLTFRKGVLCCVRTENDVISDSVIDIIDAIEASNAMCSTDMPYRSKRHSVAIPIYRNTCFDNDDMKESHIDVNTEELESVRVDAF